MKVLWLGQQERTEELLGSTEGSWHNLRDGMRGILGPGTGRAKGWPLLTQVSPTLPFKTRAALSANASVFASYRGSN